MPTTSALLDACKRSRSDFLDGLAPTALEEVLSAATLKRFPAKAVIATQGDPADQVFLLMKGRARHYFITREGKKLIMLWLAPGDILGGAALLAKPSLYLVTTEALEASCTLLWDRATIRRLAKLYPQLLENAILTASEYLAWYCAAHASLATESAQERLSQSIACLAQVIGREVPDGVELDVTNEELAEASNITPFTASRLLSKWQRSGIIAKRRGKIVLRSSGRLLSQATNRSISA